MPLWLNSESYNALAIRAVRETPLHHAFMTEYAGSSSVMVGKLDWPGRFGDEASLKLVTAPGSYLRELAQRGFKGSSTLFDILQRYIPEPAVLVSQGVSLADFYGHYDSYASLEVGGDGGASPFDPIALTDDLWTAIVTPTLATGALFRQHPYLTRMFTALSPEDMNADPVFSENASLPDVPSVHQATLTVPCRGQAYLLSPESGLSTQYPRSSSSQLQAALRIETLREEGAPVVDQDNRVAIQSSLGQVDYGSAAGAKDPSNPQPALARGCSAGYLFRGDVSSLLLAALAIVLMRRHRRRATSA
jgi:hypothetical protein